MPGDDRVFLNLPDDEREALYRAMQAAPFIPHDSHALTPPRVLVRVLPHGVGLPAYQTPGAAGMDLCAAWGGDDAMQTWPGGRNVGWTLTLDRSDLEAVTIRPGQVAHFGTGIALAIPPGWHGEVLGRSGLLFRHGVHVPQTGIIDSDYRGEVRVALHNAGSEPFVVRRGDRIAQLVISPAPQAVLAQVDALPESERGAGGFGSTGIGGGR